jgi:hypothetical protein
MNEPRLPPALRVKDVANRLLVDPHRVLSWIRAGKLPGIDVSGGERKRPRWRIRPEDLEAFELRERTGPPAPRTRRSKSGWNFQYF